MLAESILGRSGQTSRHRIRHGFWILPIALTAIGASLGPVSRAGAAEVGAASISLSPSFGPPGSSTVVSGQGYLLAFNAAGCGLPVCQPIWKAFGNGDPISAMNSSPTVANGVVYVGENQNRIYAFNAAGCGAALCSQLWEFITQGSIVNSSPTVVNGTLYVGGSNFGQVPELYVFKLFGQGG